MIKLIMGEMGKGKTKYLLDNVNEAVKTANGSIVYLDKSAQQMYDLNNKVRLIDISEYDIFNSSEFFGFITGVASQDHDLEYIFIDSFLKVAKVDQEKEAIVEAIERLAKLSEKCDITFVISVSRNKADLPEIPNTEIIVAL